MSLKLLALHPIHSFSIRFRVQGLRVVVFLAYFWKRELLGASASLQLMILKLEQQLLLLHALQHAKLSYLRSRENDH